MTQRDARQYCRECDLCQQLGQSTEQARRPHQLVLLLEPLHTLIATRTGLRLSHNGTIPRRQQRNFCTNTSGAGFGCPIELISDQGGHFLNAVIAGLMQHYGVVHKKSTPYYPQPNGLAESTNKTLQNIQRKIVNENRIDWTRNSTMRYGHTGQVPKLTYRPHHSSWCMAWKQ